MTTHQQLWNELPLVAATSHDPDTQTACIIHPQRGHLIEASNQVPVTLRVTPERVTRPAKYDNVMHAEDSAICLAARYGIATMHATMYLNWFPCNGCAMKIVQAGISELHVDRAAYEARKDDPRYGFALSMEKLVEVGVRIVWH